VIDTIKTGYKAARDKVTSNYKTVGDLTKDEPLKIAGTYVRETVIPSIQDWARKGSTGRAFDLGRQGMENAKRLYEQSTAFAKMDKISSLNFFRMEDWRSRVSQALAKPMIDPTEKTFLSGMLERYDRAIQTLPREAIKSGDDAVIDAMEKARMSRKEQGVLFERSKLVKDIIDNEDLTREQFANTITSLGDKTGSYVKQLLNTARNNPATKEQIREDIRKSVMGNILNKSMSAEVKAGTADGAIERMISFDKLGTQLDKLVKNKTLMQQLYPDNESRLAVERLYKDVQLIKSTKPGTKNYSNTAYTLLNFLRGVSPTAEKANVFGIGAGTTLKAMGEGKATLELEKSLAPVLKGISEEMTGPLMNFANKYGRQIAVESAAQIPTIEVRPLPEE
jgi:hypothetical protein